MVKGARENRKPEREPGCDDDQEEKTFTDFSLAAEALRHVRHMAKEYDPWLKVGMTLHILGDRGLLLWEEWSKSSPDKYEAGACAEKWPTFSNNGNGFTLGSQFHWAAEKGWKYPRQVIPFIGRGKQPAATSEPSSLDAKLAKFMRTDLGNGERLVARHGQNFRYCHPWGKPLVWDGQRWSVDQVASMHRKAKHTVRRIYAEAATLTDDEERDDTLSWGQRSESRDRISAMIDCACKEKGIPILPEHLDVNRWLLNVQNGTIDLKSGQLFPHKRENLITSLAPVTFNPSATCPLWDATLVKILGGNKEMIGFMDRIFGMCLTGDVSQEILPIFHGSGANGKSTILAVMLEILGPDYACAAPPGLLMIKHGETHPTERAMLFGKRLVVDMESTEGARLNEQFVKQMTGRDKITTRRMREDFWDFWPTHKLIVCTNHKSEIKETVDAIWRRLHLIPFEVRIPDSEQIIDMSQKLRAEHSGILARCVRGCLDWQHNGLCVPDEVKKATKGYRDEQDVIGDFLRDECIEVPQARAKASKLYGRYKLWAERCGEKILTQRTFGMAMTERGFERYTDNGTYYRSLGLRDEKEGTQEVIDKSNVKT